MIEPVARKCFFTLLTSLRFRPYRRTCLAAPRTPEVDIPFPKHDSCRRHLEVYDVTCT